MITRKFYLIIIIFVSFTYFAKAQLLVTSGAGITPQQLVQNVLVGSGVTVSNVKFNGSTAALTGAMMGSFTTGTTPTNLGLTSGLILSSGGVTGAVGPNGSGSTTTPTGMTTVVNDPQLQALVPNKTVNESAVLEFDFVPLADTIKFRYVFGSEEYPEFVNTSYNDVFGFFISGLNPFGPSYVNKNIALIPNTNLPVCIDNVNISMNSQYFITNTGSSIQYDGFTTVLTAWAVVIPCTPYHMKLAIADCGDAAYDSGVFLEANSFTSQGVSIHTIYSQPGVASNAIEGCNNAIIGFKLPYVTSYNYQIPIVSVGGTATNGVDYPTLPSMVIIPAGSDSTTLIISPFADGITEGNETIRLIVQSSACGYDTINIVIQDYTQLTAVAYGDTIVCGGSVPLKVIPQNGLSPYQYTWSNGLPSTANVTATPTATTMYYISVKDACQNIAKDSVFVKIDCTFADAGPDTTICIGGTAKLTASGGPFFLWNTANADTTATINVSPTVTTTYIVTVTNIFTDTDTVTVFVNPLPVIVATSTPSTICPGESSQLLATGAQTYQWTANPGDNTLNGQQNLNNPLVSPLTNTIYTVKGIDSNTCANTTTIGVNVSPLPKPFIFVSPNPVSVFSPVVHIYDGNSTSTNWYWDLGDGTVSNQGNFYHTYSDQDTGRYLVKLIVSNIHGCVDSTEAWVVVRPDGTYYVPNTFTPNGDGKNDRFKVYGMGVQEFEIFIYDRWGKMVYNSKDMNEGWDGKSKDRELPDGIYNYVVIYKDEVGIKHTKPGSVTLIR